MQARVFGQSLEQPGREALFCCASPVRVDAGRGVDCSTLPPADIYEIGGQYGGGRCDDNVGFWQCGAWVRDRGVVATFPELQRLTSPVGRSGCLRAPHLGTGRFLPGRRVARLGPEDGGWQARSGP